MATRTKTIRRRSFRGRKSGGMKIPIAIVAGFVPGISYASESAASGDWKGAMERVSLSYLAFKPSAPYGFNTSYLGKGLIPALVGMTAHGLANRFGINRWIGKLGLPVEI